MYSGILGYRYDTNLSLDIPPKWETSYPSPKQYAFAKAPFSNKSLTSNWYKSPIFGSGCMKLPIAVGNLAL